MEPRSRATPYRPISAPRGSKRTSCARVDNPNNEPRNSRARTPHHLLKGIITPNGLHFTICHGGVPDIDPARHRLVIHGMVKQPLVFTLDALERYPMVSRIGFVECGGNSAPLFSNEPIQANVQALHGLASCSEWTGVLLSTLLEEAGVDPKAKWIDRRGRRLAASDAAACRSPRAWMTPWSPCTRTASASSPARAIRCGCGCPATKAT